MFLSYQLVFGAIIVAALLDTLLVALNLPWYYRVRIPLFWKTQQTNRLLTTKDLEAIRFGLQEDYHCDIVGNTLVGRTRFRMFRRRRNILRLRVSARDMSLHSEVSMAMAPYLVGLFFLLNMPYYTSASEPSGFIFAIVYIGFILVAPIFQARKLGSELRVSSGVGAEELRGKVPTE
jgi:hypothetical protein